MEVYIRANGLNFREIDQALSADEQQDEHNAIIHYKEGKKLIRSALEIETSVADSANIKSSKEKLVRTLQYAEERLTELSRSNLHSKFMMAIAICSSLDICDK